MPIRGGPHPKEWKAVLKQVRRVRKKCDLLIFSLHWNYNWVDDIESEQHVAFQEFAHLLIDNGVDIIHGHSPHHLLPVEHYRTKKGGGRDGVIFYSLGDLIDDYAVDRRYRNDLGALARISVSCRHSSTGTSRSKKQISWKLNGVFPTRIKDMQVDLVHSSLDRAFIQNALGPDVHVF